MKLKHLLILFALVVITNACLKEGDESKVNFYYIDQFFDVEINMHNDTDPDQIILSDTSGKVIENWQFEYNDNIVLLNVIKDDDITLKRKFFMNEQALADSSMDTSFFSDYYRASLSKYYYNVDKLDYEEIYIEARSKNNDELLQYAFNKNDYSYVNGNTSEIEKINLYTYYSCSDYFYYKDSLNIVDVNDVVSFLVGRKNKNLTGLEYPGHNCSSSDYTPENGYYYELNEDGLIDVKIQILVPGFSRYASKVNLDRMNYSYTYNFPE